MTKTVNESARDFTDTVHQYWQTRQEMWNNERIIRSSAEREQIHETAFNATHLPVNNIREVQSWLVEQLDAIPEASRDSAEIRFDTTMEYGETYPDVTISYWRWETDDEMNARLTKRSELLEAQRARKEEDERRQFQALQAKYGETAENAKASENGK